jgi:hypothetical protein
VPDGKRTDRISERELDGHELMSGAIVVAKAAGHALADDVVGLPGWEPAMSAAES